MGEEVQMSTFPIEKEVPVQKFGFDILFLLVGSTCVFKLIRIY